ncbi:LysE family transporter [Paenibacillus sp. HN-1]|uniref:LysE family transporter n=1 Tax=Paenibacillus TaxID=44249 RepID=UPI001CA80110|nr:MULTISPECIES: LysE family transporter [Paenibacillus]MBY9081760.1 LysE family transporter [Paenibacillus sp. CGMCC 1.18879]MBY9083629.1 LysE family transporter [Paenibacillus sinensis]
MLLRGFKFGLLLQLAVGPVCLFILRTASAKGFGSAEAAVLGVALIDGLYIVAALSGISHLASRDKPKTWLCIPGAAVLVLFGADMLAGAAGHPLLPSLSVHHSTRGGSFVQALLLTAANPLTLLFWTGVFAAKTAEWKLDSGQRQLFGLGCLLSTVFFLTAVSLAGELIKPFMTPALTGVLNGLIGLLFLGFAWRLIRSSGLLKSGGPTA